MFQRNKGASAGMFLHFQQLCTIIYYYIMSMNIDYLSMCIIVKKKKKEYRTRFQAQYAGIWYAYIQMFQ